jgi:hypothetical protein
MYFLHYYSLQIKNGIQNKTKKISGAFMTGPTNNVLLKLCTGNVMLMRNSELKQCTPQGIF